MKIANFPPKQGLYDPRFEHDACGVGFVVNIKGEKSHEIVEEALTVLQNLDHRGPAVAKRIPVTVRESCFKCRMLSSKTLARARISAA